MATRNELKYNIKKQEDKANGLLHKLFTLYDEKYFCCKLSSQVKIRWSKRMTGFAAVITEAFEEKPCEISLSRPLMELRPMEDLLETLLHEMIHAYLWAIDVMEKEVHGPAFHVKKMWFCDHALECGTFIKVKEPNVEKTEFDSRLDKEIEHYLSRFSEVNTKVAAVTEHREKNKRERRRTISVTESPVSTVFPAKSNKIGPSSEKSKTKISSKRDSRKALKTRQATPYVPKGFASKRFSTKKGTKKRNDGESDDDDSSSSDFSSSGYDDDLSDNLEPVDLKKNGKQATVRQPLDGTPIEMVFDQMPLGSLNDAAHFSEFGKRLRDYAANYKTGGHPTHCEARQCFTRREKQCRKKTKTKSSSPQQTKAKKPVQKPKKRRCLPKISQEPVQKPKIKQSVQEPKTSESKYTFF